MNNVIEFPKRADLTSGRCSGGGLSRWLYNIAGEREDMEMRIIKAWTIKHPRGALLLEYVNMSKRRAKENFCKEHTFAEGWKSALNNGYLCVRVDVSEGK
jgi:hypothetical protein